MALPHPDSRTPFLLPADHGKLEIQPKSVLRSRTPLNDPWLQMQWPEQKPSNCDFLYSSLYVFVYIGVLDQAWPPRSDDKLFHDGQIPLAQQVHLLGLLLYPIRFRAENIYRLDVYEDFPWRIPVDQVMPNPGRLVQGQMQPAFLHEKACRWENAGLVQKPGGSIAHSTDLPLSTRPHVLI